MSYERIIPRGWYDKSKPFQQRVTCDSCHRIIGEEAEGSGELDKYIYSYPMYRCGDCKKVAEHEYDRYVTSRYSHDEIEGEYPL